MDVVDGYGGRHGERDLLERRLNVQVEDKELEAASKVRIEPRGHAILHPLEHIYASKQGMACPIPISGPYLLPMALSNDRASHTWDSDKISDHKHDKKPPPCRHVLKSRVYTSFLHCPCWLGVSDFV